MNLTGVDSYVQQITKGAIIALAVIYDIKSKNKKTRKVILLPKGETK
jgi:inositol transport system permease protein